MVLNSAAQLCWSLRERISDFVRIDDADIVVDIIVFDSRSGRFRH